MAISITTTDNTRDKIHGDDDASPRKEASHARGRTLTGRNSCGRLRHGARHRLFIDRHLATLALWKRETRRVA